MGPMEDEQYEFQSLEELADAIDAQKQQQGPPAIEVWQDYDPSQRFVAVFPVTDVQGATSSTVAYYIFQPGKHSGLHSDNAEEVLYVADGEGEIFVTGSQQKLEPGNFLVIPAHVQHDIYAHGDRELQLLSFFPVSVVLSTFQDPLLPIASNTLASNFNVPVAREITADELPPELRHLAGG